MKKHIHSKIVRIAVRMVAAMILTSAACSKSVSDPARTLSARKAALDAQIKDEYDLGDTRGSRDELIRDFVQFMAAGKTEQALALVMNADQYRNQFYPNLPDKWRLDPGRDPEAALGLAMLKRDMGFRGLRNKLQGRPAKIEKIEWKKETQQYGAFTRHDPRHIVVLSDDYRVSAGEIKVVVEHRGRYKIAVLNTD